MSEEEAIDNLIMLQYFTMERADKEAIDIVLKLIDKQKEEIEKLEDIKKEHKIMQRIIKENGLWETLLNDDEFSKYLLEE